jgi:hypothetical protein
MTKETMRTDITHEKVQKASYFEMLPDPLDATQNAVQHLLHDRKQLAIEFLKTGDENLLHLIAQCNRSIIQIMAL